ncbi:transposase, partial [Demequina sp. NBRC 110056]
IDAELIARSVLGVDTSRLRQPRTDQGERAALRILLAARDQLTGHRTTTINMLTALIRTTALGIELDARASITTTLIRTIAAWRTRTEPVATAIARAEAARLAKTILATDADLKANQAHITSLLPATPAAALLTETGIGPITAAAIYVSWSHAGRLRSEGAFAALAGVSPLPASSGNTTRHRLNRGGDRRLNAALHTITLTRMRIDQATRDYIARRQTEGLTLKEIRRILKRYIARHIHRTLTHATATMPT